MSIWFQDFTLEDLQKVAKNTMVDYIGIEYTAIGDDYIRAKMPVDQRTIQPAGLLHGGASVVLAETLGSVGAYLCVDPTRFNCVGLEINANHLRPVTKGFVEGTGKPVHLGQKIQVWEIDIHDERKKLVCKSRITIAVIENSKNAKNINATDLHR